MVPDIELLIKHLVNEKVTGPCLTASAVRLIIIASITKQYRSTRKKPPTLLWEDEGEELARQGKLAQEVTSKDEAKPGL